jgi:hypothetical protein
MLIMGIYKIPVGWSLAATALILVATMVLSVLIPPRAEPTRAGKSSLASAPSAKLRAARKADDGEDR